MVPLLSAESLLGVRVDETRTFTSCVEKTYHTPQLGVRSVNLEGIRTVIASSLPYRPILILIRTYKLIVDWATVYFNLKNTWHFKNPKRFC